MCIIRTLTNLLPLFWTRSPKMCIIRTLTNFLPLFWTRSPKICIIRTICSLCIPMAIEVIRNISEQQVSSKLNLNSQSLSERSKIWNFSGIISKLDTKRCYPVCWTRSPEMCIIRTPANLLPWCWKQSVNAYVICTCTNLLSLHLNGHSDCPEKLWEMCI